MNDMAMTLKEFRTFCMKVDSAVCKNNKNDRVAHWRELRRETMNALEKKQNNEH